MQEGEEMGEIWLGLGLIGNMGLFMGYMGGGLGMLWGKLGLVW